MIISAAAALLACLLSHQTISVAQFGVQGDGIVDSGPALQRAFDSAKPGDVLVIPAGRYLVKGSLVLRQDHVTVVGDHATLVAATPDDQATVIAGNNDVLFGINFIGTGTQRLGGNASTKIEVTGNDDTVENNNITGGASVGIFVYGGSNFSILNNDVSATLADGIHMTNGANNGLVSGNQVSANGDDMIAVVSYAGKGPIDSDILIEENSVSGNYLGRGITVVGGKNVTIEDNNISDVKSGAGIYLAEEEGRYHTRGVHNIIIRKNRIKNIETAVTFLPKEEQPAIYLFTWKGSISDVSIEKNFTDGASFGGFEANGNICSINASGNEFKHITGGYFADFRDCALNIFHHCKTNNMAQIKPCTGEKTVSVTGSSYPGQSVGSASSGHLRDCGVALRAHP